MPQNILLIQDSPGDAQVVQTALTEAANDAFLVEWVNRCSDGLQRLAGHDQQEANGFAAIVLDLYLPDSQGIETFDCFFSLAPQIPILVITSLHDEDTAKVAVQRGAQDYLVKGRIDSYLLQKAVCNMIDRAANVEALFDEKERAQITLDSIGDAVISADARGRVTYLNLVAEGLTGWIGREAVGRSLEEVMHIIDAATRSAVDNPMRTAIRIDQRVGLTPGCILIRRDGVEAAIEDTAAPIHDRRGRVTGAVMVFHDVSAARAQSQRMIYLAQHDSLTDLPNRILLEDRISQAIALANRHRKPLAVLFLDMDRFKHVNDSLGHAIGDRLLQSVAKRLMACVRNSDTVSRQGGDEFVILLSDMTHLCDAAVTAEKILLSLAKPYSIDQHELHLSASIGIATYPEDGTDVTTLMKNADAAMYHAKSSGRGNHQFFKQEMNLRAIERQSIENGLHQAMERQEFVMHYQPKVDLETGTVVGAEALIRWQHPERGLLLPGGFISIAEECGLIVPIGRWALRESCRQARAWQDAGLPPIRLAVNTSVAELRARDFVVSVGAVLEETGLCPSHLELELTETFLMQDSKSTAEVLRALKGLGVQIALDDFGTGYSSLSHLKRFPIDTLKIDQTFVRHLATDADDASIVGAVIGIGRSLRMRVVAEGVETPEQLAFLRQQRCPEGQGFLFSRAVDPEKFAGLMH